ncbi:MAG: hypothetical protein H0T42_12320 [Deltaproteobacteria bacterium]|nr:hypothetical protein [Deltaproteobacteria bacterium]
MTADINTTATAIEAFVQHYIAAGVAPKEVQVRPSGDDLDVIKVWIDLGSAKVDVQAWARECEIAIEQHVPDAAAFQIAVRVESEP